MNNNKRVANVNGKDALCVGGAQKRVLRAYARLKTWRDRKSVV